MSEPVLSVTGLSVEFRTPRGRLRALRDVDLQVPAESIVGIVGESGCGKSTLISAIIRLLAPNAEVLAGRIEFEGRDLLTLDQDQMRALRGDRMSMVFQDPMTTLNPVLTVGRQMTDIQYRSRLSSAEKRELSALMLRRVGIPDAEKRLDNYPHEFSGGMRQRVSIAMALQAEPALLIADEPTTALDATLEVQIIERLRKLHGDIGCSILFVSHHLGLVAEFCDEVVVMYAGETVESGDGTGHFSAGAPIPYTAGPAGVRPGAHQGRKAPRAADHSRVRSPILVHLQRTNASLPARCPINAARLSSDARRPRDGDLGRAIACAAT